MNTCQVLVVGAGPTGLTLAAQLLARGIDTRIVDRADRPALQSRAIGVHARTLELLATMGLADAFIDSGHKVRRFRMYAGTRTLLNLDLARNGSPYGFVLHLPQCDTERLLRARVRELGGTIEQGVELVGLADRGSVVHATVRDIAGGRTGISADYVVGCDGAHSRVRHELALPFDGQPYPHDWLLADVTLDGIERDDETHAFCRPDGLPLACLPLGGGRWRVVMSNVSDRGGWAPSFDEIRDLVEQRAPRRLDLSDPGWLACFRCSLRSTTSYRRGRVLLAGDAAHIHSPAGGQGMNTGMMDAANLAWKLALVAEHRAPDGLLDTYGAERLPAGGNVLRLSDRIASWSMMRQPIKRALRDAIVPAITGLPAVQNRAARRLSQISVAYPSSPLTRPATVRRGPRPGQRAPDVEVCTTAGPARLHTALAGGRHVLLVSGGAAPGDLDPYDGLVDVVEGTLDRSGRDAFALVRPDGFLAARGSASEVFAYLRQFSVDRAPVAAG